MRTYRIQFSRSYRFNFFVFSALDVDHFTLYLPIILRSPVKSATPSIAITAGAAIIVDNKPIPPAPAPMVIVIKTVSTLSTILAALKYFLLNLPLSSTSFSKNA